MTSRSIDAGRPRPIRRLLRVAAGCAGVALAVASRPAAAQSPVLQRDSAVYTGKLPNGLRYWIRHNSYPAHRLELRLVVHAGSILEADDQRGLAHFIEHMAFNGTTHFARNDLVKYLESIGVRFGADLNAETSFDQTIYILPVPTDSAGVVPRAFDVLQDWAMGDQFDSSEVVAERGVVLGEWRSGLGAGSRVRDREFPVLFQGSRYASRLPIGDTAIIAHAEPSQLKQFYHDWYRPDLMGIVAVGDFPVDSIRALIESHFAGMRNPAHERPRTDAAVPDLPGTRVAVITDSELTGTGVQLLIRRPTVVFQTEADERRELIYRLFANIAGQRIGTLVQNPSVPYTGMSFGPSRLIRDISVFALGVSGKEGQSAAAFRAALAELRRFDEHGVLPAELDRAKATIERGAEDAAAEQGHTESDEYVGDYINAFLNGDITISAAEELALVRRMLPTITVDEMNAAIRDASQGNDRFIALTAPARSSATLPGADSLRAIVRETDTLTTAPWTEAALAAVLVPDPPTPGRIVSETTNRDVGVTDWKLSNGVRVLVKPTDFKADQVLMTADIPGGYSTIPDSLLLDAQLAVPYAMAGGAGVFDAPSLAKRMAGKIAQVFPTADETSSDLVAISAPKDLESALQLLWLRVTAPRYDSTAAAALQSAVRTQLANRDLAPTTALQDTVELVMGDHSPRAQPLSVERFNQVDPRESLALYRDFFADFGDATFVIVGAVNVDSLRPLVARWLGGLPATSQHRSWRDVQPRPPDSVVERTVHKGKEPVAHQVVAFTGTPAVTDLATRLNGEIAAEVLQQRLLDRLREAMGATYSVTVNVDVALAPHPAYTAVIAFTSAPAQADTMWVAAQQLIDSLRRTGPTADELEKVVAQLHQSTEVAVKTNDWWLQELSEYTSPDGHDPGQPLSGILDWNKRLDAVTAAGVQAAARVFFDPARTARFILLPETPAP